MIHDRKQLLSCKSQKGEHRKYLMLSFYLKTVSPGLYTVCEQDKHITHLSRGAGAFYVEAIIYTCWILSTQSISSPLYQIT